ncbi:unnamed protein product [Ceratitis capitata]|uniref:(Mediterranean fruit fly) hypothetical protein n=1 Tax=Ceratitis capitata TaxID=7213 RepID=A0A811UGP9_CERCA|nr:unnamed protein product [Ceratitis capitata]
MKIRLRERAKHAPSMYATTDADACRQSNQHTYVSQHRSRSFALGAFRRRYSLSFSHLVSSTKITNTTEAKAKSGSAHRATASGRIICALAANTRKGYEEKQQPRSSTIGRIHLDF